MEKITTWTQLIMDSLSVLGQNIMAAIPSILGALFIILIGWLIAKLMSVGIKKSLKLIKFDKISENVKMADFLAKSNISISPSVMVAKFIYWIIILIFFVLASDTLGWNVVSDSVSDLIFYLPKLLSAIAVFIIGLIIANFVKKALKGVFDSLNVLTGKMISNIAFYIIVIIIGLTALTQAGVDTHVITSNMNLILGGIILAFAVAFGFGAKDILSNILSAYYSKSTFVVGQTIEMGNIKGTIEKIDGISVIIKTTEGKVVIPSKKIVEEKVIIK